VSRDVTSATITAEVEGTARKPKLVLLSNPSIYSQAEILSMIISGDPAAQDTAAQPLDQQVIGAVSGAIVGRIKDQIAPQLPIDVIKLDVGSQDYTPFSTARLEIGKFLTDSIYVSYAHRFGSQVTLRPVNENEGSLEYRFLRRYTLQTIFGDEAVGSIDLFWSKRY
jgi:translocation and assembly module TamB